MISAPSIFLENLHLSYQNEILFEKLNLTIPSGKCTCLLGPSGIGKSTLLKLIAGLIPAKLSGEFFHGLIRCDNSSPVSEQVAYMPQMDLLLPWLTAFDNALMGYRLRGSVPVSILEHANHLFSLAGLENAKKKFPSELSGGMRQRVSLIRTLLEEKPVVLMDEPFSALDAITRFQLQTLTAKLLKNRTILLVTHDPLEALRLADTIVILSGKPARAHIMQLESTTPRDVNHPEVIQMQAELFNSAMSETCT
jgi:putative hydroxymethylpyrimidine transport system ATP-binding protein